MAECKYYDDETKIIMSQKVNRQRAFRLPTVCLPHALTTIGVTFAAPAYDDSEAFISPLVRADCPLPKTPTPKLPQEPV
jgi:hypothetical protein